MAIEQFRTIASNKKSIQKETKIRSSVMEMAKWMNDLEKQMVYLRLSTPIIGNIHTQEEEYKWYIARNYNPLYNSAMKKMTKIICEFDLEYEELRPYLAELFPVDYKGVEYREKIYRDAWREQKI